MQYTWLTSMQNSQYFIVLRLDCSSKKLKDIKGIIWSWKKMEEIWYWKTIHLEGSSPNRVKPKTIELVICCFSAKHASLRKKSKDWLARNQDNESKWSDMFMQNSQYFIVLRLDCSSKKLKDIKGIIWSWKKMEEIWYWKTIQFRLHVDSHSTN
jgi:hypothetical protein